MKTIVLLILLTQVGCAFSTFIIHATGSMVGNVLGDVVLEEIKKENKDNKEMEYASHCDPMGVRNCP